MLRDVTTKDLHLVGKINNQIFNIPKLLPLNAKIDIKLQLAVSNFILQKVLGTAPDATVFLTSAILHLRKKQVISSVALAIEKLRAGGNNIKLTLVQRITNQRHISTATRTYTDSRFINGEIISELALESKVINY